MSQYSTCWCHSTLYMLMHSTLYMLISQYSLRVDATSFSTCWRYIILYVLTLHHSLRVDATALSTCCCFSLSVVVTALGVLGRDWKLNDVLAETMTQMWVFAFFQLLCFFYPHPFFKYSQRKRKWLYITQFGMWSLWFWPWTELSIFCVDATRLMIMYHHTKFGCKRSQ